MLRPRPKTGEKRQVQQPLKIDRLPVEARDAILHLRDIGKTWPEIEELSALPKERGGFVEWDALALDVLELFPSMRLPHSSLHRWYDLRFRQVMVETMARSAQAREIATAFAKSAVDGADEAVLNAARDQIMSVLAEGGPSGGRMKAAKALIDLGFLVQTTRANEIKQRKVTVDEKALQMKLDEVKRRTEKLLKSVESGAADKPVQITREQLLGELKELYGAI
ncbi:MAG: hypothetical protein ACYCSP_05985 [Acidobacteriaceae bacterium]